MTREHITDECWQDFADAIVLSAVDDWRRSKMQMHVPSLASKYAAGRIAECERFFQSKWFEILTGIDGKVFLRRIKEGFSFA